jgi:hypothetical protein
MLALNRRRASAASARNQLRPPRVEVLECRALPSNGLPDVAILSARLEAPTVVRFDYRAAGNPGVFQVGVYRSTDQALSGDDVAVASGTVTPPGGGLRVGRITLTSEMPIDPARKFVLVVADPGGTLAEQNEVNNTAFFRKLVVGAVTHGFTLTGTAPAWTEGVAQVLRQKGYDAAFAFDWAPLSQLPVPGGTVLAGQALAARVRVTARAVAVLPNDVVDLHLIGHSRGTAVVSQAFAGLQRLPGPRALQLGFFQQTLLDPHVARNQGALVAGLAELAANTGESHVGQFSYDETSPAARLFGAGVLAFQALAQDPPAFVPANVDLAEVFYQRLAWDQTAPGSPDRQLGLNFWSVLPGDIPNSSGRPILSLDVGRFGIGHYGVPLWYLANRAPSLA